MGQKCSCFAKLPLEHRECDKLEKINVTDAYSRVPTWSIGRDDPMECVEKGDYYFGLQYPNITKTPSSDDDDCYDNLDTFCDLNSNFLPRMALFGFLRMNCSVSNVPNVPTWIFDQIANYYHCPPIPSRRKRVIFTSLVNLNLCISDIPNVILDESIFYFRITDQMNDKSLKSLMESLKCDLNLQPKMKYYLKQKYDANMLLLLSPSKTWKDISNELCSITDIWYNYEKCYQPLSLQINEWIDYKQNHLYTNHNVSITQISHEIKHADLKFFPSMEILWHSNRTLIPMTSFDPNMYHNHNAFNSQCCIEKNQKIKNANTIAVHNKRILNEESKSQLSSDCLVFLCNESEYDEMEKSFTRTVTKDECKCNLNCNHDSNHSFTQNQPWN